MNFLSCIFFFYKQTALSSRAVDGDQMYSGGSVELVLSHDSRSAVKVQGQEVKGQCHSAT